MRAAAAIGIAVGNAAAAAPPPTVRTATGIVAGASERGVERFFGIPFAAPPIGPLRWRAPQPARAWPGVRAATSYGADCMQQPFPSDAAPLGTTPAEDCLTVNVWRPAGARPGAHLPVLVWIYGGGNVNGGASPAVYSGDAFARDGVVMVSFNWRVGRFGFFGFPALTKADADHGLLANYGYMDSIAALRWVRRNVAAFGGDPRMVTIYGQSAGAGQVAMLLSSPEARGLFARAIIQSGGAQEKPPLAQAERAGVAFAKQVGIEGTDAAALAKLRALTPDKVTAGLHIGTSAAQQDIFAGPVVDGRLLTGLLTTAVARAQQARVPLLIGSTSADNFSMMQATSVDEALATTFAGVSDQARAAYVGPTGPDRARVLREMGRDLAYNEPDRFVASNWARQGLPAYVYRFGYVANAMRREWQEGPPHATDIPFAMDTVGTKYGAALTDRDEAAARTMHGYWVNFVKTGDPNGRGLPAWPRYAPGEDRIMIFGPDGAARATPDPYKARIDAVAEARHR